MTVNQNPCIFWGGQSVAKGSQKGFFEDTQCLKTRESFKVIHIWSKIVE